MTDEEIQLTLFGFVEDVPPGSTKAKIIEMAHKLESQGISSGDAKAFVDKMHAAIEAAGRKTADAAKLN